jgi:hypothetical protein
VSPAPDGGVRKNFLSPVAQALNDQTMRIAWGPLQYQKPVIVVAGVGAGFPVAAVTLPTAATIATADAPARTILCMARTERLLVR